MRWGPTGESDQTLLWRVANADLAGTSPVHGTHAAHAGRADQPLGSERGHLARRLPAEVEENSACRERFIFFFLILSLNDSRGRRPNYERVGSMITGVLRL